MTANEPIQGGPYPLPSDLPDGPAQMKAIVEWAATLGAMRFANTTARDTALPSPVAGMVAVTGTGSSLIVWCNRSGTVASWEVVWRPFQEQVVSSLSSATGTSGADLYHSSVGVSLPAGVWELSAEASVDTTAGSGVAAVGLSVGASLTLLTGSLGPAGTVSTTQRTPLSSAALRVTVASTTAYYALAAQGGGITLRMSSLGNSPAARVRAVRVG